MQNDGYLDPFENERRDLLREIDAGELDERYLIKHSPDYGRRPTAHPVSALQRFLGRLLRIRGHVVQSQYTDTPMQIVLHSVPQR
jgi:hypothetical protein